MTEGGKKGSAKIHNFCIFARKLIFDEFKLHLHKHTTFIKELNPGNVTTALLNKWLDFFINGFACTENTGTHCTDWTFHSFSDLFIT